MSSENKMSDYNTFNDARAEQSEEGVERQQRQKLKRSLGLPSACSLVITMTIGSGIFISPKEVALPSGMPILSLVVWLLSGLLIVLAAYCYTELGLMMPETGGEYVFCRKMWGDFAGFMYVWMTGIIEMTAIVSVIALATATYMCSIVNYTPPSHIQKGVATALILAFTVINCSSVKLSKMVNNISTVVKCGALVFIITAGIVHISQGHTKNLSWEKLTMHYDDEGISAGSLALSYFSATYTYSGWQNLPTFIEEINNPSKNLPRALFIAIPVITALYTATNVIFIAVLGGAQVVYSQAIAADTAHLIFPFAQFAVPICVTIACIGALCSTIAVVSRTFLSGARHGHMPAFFHSLHRTQSTPIPALIFQAMLTTTCIWIADIDFLMPVAGFIISVVSFLVVAGLLKLRFTQPDRERQIKPFIGIPLFVAIVFLGIIAFSFTISSKNVIVAAVMCLAGIPVYITCVFWKNKPACYTLVSEKICTCILAVTCCVPEADEKELVAKNDEEQITSNTI